MNVLEINNLNFSFDEKPLFRNFNLEIKQGEAICILGESGSGKSTLLELIAKSLKCDKNSIRVNKVSQIFQDPYTSFHHSYSIINQMKDVCNTDDIYELLEVLKLDKELIYKKPFELSGGELQRLSIIRALLMKPKLLLADEPTSALDKVVELELMKFLVTRLKDMAIIFVTHDEDLAKWFADRIIYTKDFDGQ